MGPHSFIDLGGPRVLHVGRMHTGKPAFRLPLPLPALTRRFVSVPP